MTNLRTEYEARMGKVDCTGYWAKRQWDCEGSLVSLQLLNERGLEVYFENSFGSIRDNRPNKAKIFTGEDGTKYKVVEVLK